MAVLALQWAWSGAIYHLMWFRRINPAAVLFGMMFLLEAGLLLWRGFPKASWILDRPSGWRRLPAVGLVAYALLYPGIALLLGMQAPRFPSFGVPCPTTLLTFGMLLLMPRREALILGVIPMLWAIVGGSAAWLL